MNRLEMQALANLLNGWGLTDTPTGTARSGDVSVLVVGHVDNFCLHIGEPIVYVTEPEVVHV